MAFDNQTRSFQVKESEFDELKKRVSKHLGILATKDEEIVTLKKELKSKGTEIIEKEV